LVSSEVRDLGGDDVLGNLFDGDGLVCLAELKIGVDAAGLASGEREFGKAVFLEAGR
jgi:hypothetical protein